MKLLVRRQLTDYAAWSRVLVAVGVFVSRMIPGVRTLASFPAGSARMKLPRFLLYIALGCFLFDSALVYAGDYLGSNWGEHRDWRAD